MNSPPIASIRNLLIVVLVIALDCYLIQYCLVNDAYLPFEGWPLLFRVGFAGSLPMMSAVVAGGFLLLPWRQGEGSFLTGFVLSGALGLFAILTLALVFPWGWLTPLYRAAHDFWWKIYLNDHYTFGLSHKEYLFAAEMVFFTVLFTIPELLIALTGGLVGRRFSRAGGDSHQAVGASSESPSVRAWPPGGSGG